MIEEIVATGTPPAPPSGSAPPVGRREEGLAAVEEAVGIRKQLTEAHPEKFLPSLASSLTSLSVDLGDLGRGEEGLVAAEEAVTFCRRLAKTRPDAFLPDLALSLNNLSACFGELGVRRRPSLRQRSCRRLLRAR